ncbi:MAG: RDD family protein [Planctomycetota bacterium]
MADRIEFETPENISISYRTAGLGSRFIAWFVDSMLLIILLFVMVILLFVLGIHLPEPNLSPSDPSSQEEAIFYVVGICWLIFSFGNFLYYGLSEYLMRGQTSGKRRVGIRVVKIDGFSLDATSIFLRSIFRIIDTLPLLWIVPFLSPKGQRLGDMVAGTVVVRDEPAAAREMTTLRERLLQSSPAEAVFRFDPATLGKARARDKEAVEIFLERADDLPADKRDEFLSLLCDPLAARLGIPAPEAEHRRRFLEDFLAAEYRRQYRHLG